MYALKIRLLMTMLFSWYITEASFVCRKNVKTFDNFTSCGTIKHWKSFRTSYKLKGECERVLSASLFNSTYNASVVLSPDHLLHGQSQRYEKTW